MKAFLEDSKDLLRHGRKCARNWFKEKITISPQELSALMDKDTLIPSLPYRLYNPDSQVYFNKETVGFVFEVEPIIGASKTTYQKITKLLQNIMPVESTLQVLLLASDRVDSMLNFWADQRQGESFRQAAQQRIKYLKKHQKNMRNYRVIVSWSKPVEDWNDLDLVAIKKFRKKVFDTFEEITGQAPTQHEPELLLGLLDELLSPNRRDKQEITKEWSKFDTLDGQAMPMGTIIDHEANALYFEKGKSFIKTFDVSKYPSRFAQSEITKLYGGEKSSPDIDCKFFINYTVYIPNNTSEYANLMKNCIHREQLASSTWVKFMPSLKKELPELSYVREQFQNNKRIVKTRFQVGIMGAAKEESELTRAIENIYADNGFELNPNEDLQLPSFLACLPMGMDEKRINDTKKFKRFKTTLVHEPANLLPIQGEWKGTKTPSLMYVNPKGQLMYLRTTDMESNAHMCIVGTTGSGKSFKLNEMVSAERGLGTYCYVIDCGKSFKKTTKEHKGHFLEFSHESDICINPFPSAELIPEIELYEDFFPNVQQLLTTMAIAPTEANSSSKVAWNPSYDNHLEDALRATWEKYRGETTIDLIAQWLSDYKGYAQNDANDLGFWLKRFTSHGSLGRHFNGKPNVDFDNPLITLELDNLQRSNTALFRVVFQMFSLFVTSNVFKLPKDVRKLKVIDEASLLFKASTDIAETIEKDARTLRKAGGALAVATQNLSDFSTDTKTKGVFTQCAWLICLQQNKAAIEEARTAGLLTKYSEQQIEMMSAVESKKGKYSDFFLKTDNISTVGRFCADPYTKILFTTDPEEWGAVDRLIASGISEHEARLIVAKERFPHEF